MKVLILGATGMLGHKLVQYLSRSFSTFGTIRRSSETFGSHPAFKQATLIEGVDAYDMNSVKNVIDTIKPDVIINSIGIVKQLPEAFDPIKSIMINSLFPHQVAAICRERQIRFIHYSTDCVFSGKKGRYREDDFPDADDLYGRSKLLGEVVDKNCLTLRTSIVGREIASSHGLIDWLLSQEGKTVKGYQQVFFSGLTTNAHAGILEQIITSYPNLNGLFHLAAPRISKFELLNIVKNTYRSNIEIESDSQEKTDRSLDNSRFREITKIIIPSWSEMINEMYQDPTPYNSVR
jgi:dTDP-4-dehydrorhamnose reductase